MLLFDENLAARLVSDLADLYPGCGHVGGHGLAGVADQAIWQYARNEGMVIVTKDEDFQRLSVFFGGAAESDLGATRKLFDG